MCCISKLNVIVKVGILLVNTDKEISNQSCDSKGTKYLRVQEGIIRVESHIIVIISVASKQKWTRMFVERI